MAAKSFRRQLIGAAACLTAFFFLAGCSRGPSQLNVRISVEHAADGDWFARYHLSKPVHALAFRRQRNQFRKKSWAVLTPGVTLEELGGREVLVSEDNSFSDVSLKLQPYTSVTPKDYEFFVPMSDGSTVLFSGHLDASPMTCPGTLTCDKKRLVDEGGVEVNTVFDFIPAPGENVVVGEETSGDHVTWTSDREGTFAYFGRLAVQDENTFKAVLDPRLPRWIVSELKGDLPRIFAFYGAKLEVPLGYKPLVLFSFTPSSVAYAAKGGVLHHQVRLVISGNTWVSANSPNLERFQQLIAHEAAHFWNADIIYPVESEGDAWLHEGGADAFSYRAMRALGMISEGEYLNLQTQALNRCVLGLGDLALDESDARGRIENSYDCGAMIGLLTEGDERLATGGDLFSFWKKLIMAARANSGMYSASTYFGALEAIDRSGLVSGLHELISERLPEPDSFFRRALSAARIGVSINVRDVPSWYEEQLGLRASRFVAETACQGSASADEAFGDYIVVSGDNDCRAFNGSFDVDRAGPFSLIYDGASAYDYIYDQCGRIGSVDFRMFGSNQNLRAPCSKIPPRPRFLSVTSD